VAGGKPHKAYKNKAYKNKGYKHKGYKYKNKHKFKFGKIGKFFK